MQTILLAESVPLFRTGMRSLLEHAGGWSVREATHPPALLEAAQADQPACAILDADSTSYDALEICWTLRQQVPAMGILVLADRLTEEQLFRFLIHGANAYEPRTLACEVFLELVKRVCAGEYLMGGERLVFRASNGAAAGRAVFPQRPVSPGTLVEPAPSPLSGRERQILQYIAWGNSNKRIAAALKISDQTVKNHITSTLKKLAVSDRTAAVMHAISHRWISMDTPTS